MMMGRPSVVLKTSFRDGLRPRDWVFEMSYGRRRTPPVSACSRS